jgi:hypothetical protein
LFLIYADLFPPPLPLDFLGGSTELLNGLQFIQVATGDTAAILAVCEIPRFSESQGPRHEFLSFFGIEVLNEEELDPHVMLVYFIECPHDTTLVPLVVLVSDVNLHA